MPEYPNTGIISQRDTVVEAVTPYTEPARANYAGVGPTLDLGVGDGWKWDGRIIMHVIMETLPRGCNISG